MSDFNDLILQLFNVCIINLRQRQFHLTLPKDFICDIAVIKPSSY
ncbi:MAG: hypothetical protein ACI8YQ_000800 [Polaribacter sp.]|jgi:hypothetical protein